MAVNIAGKSVSTANLIAAVGGILAIVAAPLAWITLSAEGHSESVTGLDEGLLGGKIVLVLGILIVAVVAAGILNIKIPQSDMILAALGVLILVVVALVYFTKLVSDESFTNTADLMKAMGGSAGFGIGLILVVVGGILAIVGGGMSLMKKA